MQHFHPQYLVLLTFGLFVAIDSILCYNTASSNLTSSKMKHLEYQFLIVIFSKRFPVFNTSVSNLFILSMEILHFYNKIGATCSNASHGCTLSNYDLIAINMQTQQSKNLSPIHNIQAEVKFTTIITVRS